MLPVRTILHATDFSAGAEVAFQLACSLARDYGARLLVLHVYVAPLVSYEEGGRPPVLADVQQPLLDQLHRLRPRDENVRVEYKLVEGNPAEEILRTAAETHSDVLILGTHGRTGLGRLLMGSVAEQVVRQATCPVVTVKAPLAHTQPPAAPPAAK
jgi:nucleotide-binding universal stress UspA family protein